MVISWMMSSSLMKTSSSPSDPSPGSSSEILIAAAVVWGQVRVLVCRTTEATRGRQGGRWRQIFWLQADVGSRGGGAGPTGRSGCQPSARRCGAVCERRAEPPWLWLWPLSSGSWDPRSAHRIGEEPPRRTAGGRGRGEPGRLGGWDGATREVASRDGARDAGARD